MNRLQSGKTANDTPLAHRASACFRFHGELEGFLAPAHRGTVLSHPYARAATLKQAIEALGVPHTEVGLVRVNDLPATLSRTVREADLVEVFPHEPGQAPFEAPLCFIADAHMGGLARMLRMLGFDTLYDNGFHDAQIVACAMADKRVVLTRDRELLKCREIQRGCYAHALKAEAQLREVARRYAIERHMQPFSLCLHCNLPFRPADAALIVNVPDAIRSHYQRFMHCPGCGRVYWEGSHWERMRRVLANTLDLPVGELGSSERDGITNPAHNVRATT
ncbi:MAG: Mut7-C RNAse domain-containing protein [Burkholderiales bacterium]